MSKNDITVEGINEVLARLTKVANQATVEQALCQACALVEASAKRNAPKGDGDLRRSIASKVEGTTGIVYTPLEYAPYVEYGTGLFAEEGGRQDVPWHYQDDEGEWHSTSGMNPHPYMRPALNENINNIKAILKEGLTKK